MLNRKDDGQMSQGQPITNGFLVSVKTASETLFGPIPHEPMAIQYDCLWTGYGSMYKATIEHPPPRFIVGLKKVYYDANGNFRRDFLSRQYVLSTKEVNRLFDYFMYQVIDTNNSVVGITNSITEEIHPIGDSQTTSSFDKIRWATGRGFGKYIEKITKDALDPLTKIRWLEADGAFVGGVKGKWRLAVDESADYLVREAHFTYNGLETLVVTNSGLVECPNLKIAASGMFKYYGNEQIYQVESLTNVISCAEDPHFIEIMNFVTAPLPPNSSEIMDFCKKPIERIHVGY